MDDTAAPTGSRTLVDLDPRDGDGDGADSSGASTQSTTARAPRTSLEVGGYALGEVLGRGGMGEVVAARDQRLERDVALKRMRDGRPDADAVARFVREAKIQARLDHPAIVPVHELGRDDAGLPYFTMKRLAGTTLHAKLAERGPIQPLLRAFVGVCFALEQAHDRGVIHRDLKPSNLMLGDYDDVYVLDWGVARVLAMPEGRAPTQPGPPPNLPLDTPPAGVGIDGVDGIDGIRGTATGALLGTPGYMAPEQLVGGNVRPPADIYALGAILFEILAGEPLHPVGNAAIVSTLHDEADPSPARRAPDRAIAPELDQVCLAALARDPAERPTARALARRVQAYLDGDRDLDHRRALAADELAAAHAALAAGDRVQAIRSAGRALALDPASQAAELVANLVLTPATGEIPPEARRELEADEIAIDRSRGLRGVLAYLAVWSLVPLVTVLEVRSVPLFVALVGCGTIMAGLVALRARGWFPAWALALCNAGYVVLFSRLGGPFLLTPLLACAVSTAIGTTGLAAERRGIALGMLAIMLIAPLALEAAGVFGHTWWMNPGGVGGGGLVSRGQVFDGRGPADAFGVIFGTVALCFVVTGYALAVNRARIAAQRAARLQAWHLRQLLPPTQR